MTSQASFWEFVQKTESCWLWTGDLSEKGYGRLSVNDQMYRAHRFIYELEVGPIPDGLVIDHICHTPACVRPDHLRAATQKQNCENRKGANRNSKSGVLGVVWEKRRNKWRVSCSHNKQEHHGGYFAGLEEAAEAARNLRLSLYTHNDADRRTP